MYALIEFILGPMIWISLLVFVLGLAWRLYGYYTLLNKKEKFVFSYISLKYSLRSIGAWLIPFFPRSTRIHPVFFSVSYLFHLLIFLVPIFLSAHIVIVQGLTGVSWPGVSDTLADLSTLVILGAIVFFAIRRITVPEIKFLTGAPDFIFLLLAALPFITGFIACHQFFAYRLMTVAHVLSGELLIMLMPFTRFFHMFLAPFTRAYTGSEFGKVRHARDW